MSWSIGSIISNIWKNVPHHQPVTVSLFDEAPKSNPQKMVPTSYTSGPQGHQLFFLWIESTTVWWFKPSVGIIIHRLETINEFQYPQIKPAISPSWDPTISSLKKHQFDPICLLIPVAFNFFTNGRIVLKMCVVTGPRTFQCFHPARAVLEVKVMPLQPENFSDSKAEKM